MTLTRIRTNFDSLSPEDVTLPIMEGRYSVLLDTWKLIKEKDLHLEVAAAGKDKSSIPYFKDDAFISAFFETYDYFNKILARLKANITLDSTIARDSYVGGAFEINKSFKSPQVTFPKFATNYLEWESFRDLYTAAVHNRADISKAQKLFYLKTCLIDDASQLLKHTAITDANYDEAWETIKKRFENKRAIISAHLHSFVSLPLMTNETAKDLKLLRDTVHKTIQGLKNLNRPVDQWDDIVYLAANKLNKDSVNKWERFLDDKSDYLTYSDFEKYLAMRIRMLESIQMTKDYFSKNNSKANNSSQAGNSNGKSRSNSVQSNATTTHTVTCILCSENHAL